MDLIQREGHYPLPPQAPTTLGVEFSGTIVSFGPDTTPPSPQRSKFTTNSPVFGLAPGGAYAEYICCSLATLLPKPPHLSFEQAAAIPETWSTAAQALHLVLELRAGQSVLWHAGASGVSIAGIQLSRLAGAAAVFATAGTREKCAFVEGELGATKAVNYKEAAVREGGWVAEVMKETGGRGVDLVVDFVGGSYFQGNLDVVAREGRICMRGLMGGAVAEKVNVGQLLYKRVRVEGSTLRSRDEEYQGRLREKLEEYLPKFESGEWTVVIDTVLPWVDIVKAHQLLEENKTMGKIICTIS
jgi:NADPH:quinone reductase-like Zn-dependent oxidoreductase